MGRGNVVFVFRISNTLCYSNFLEWFGRKSSSSSTTHPSCAVVMHASTSRRRRRRRSSNYHAPNTKGTVLEDQDDIRASLPFPSLPFPSHHEFPKIATTQTYLNKRRTRTRIQQSLFFFWLKILSASSLCPGRKNNFFFFAILISKTATERERERAPKKVFLSLWLVVFFSSRSQLSWLQKVEEIINP